ncbi:MAG: hypothetical protein F4134_10720 [Acidimicrobiaceae bacterium]|nr:hypothetical protein [Acidimicrobiaceae bacterium]
MIETAVNSLRHRPRNFPSVIEWACPVPFFGRAEKARVASVGLNPSGQEFYDRKGHPLRGNGQRLATLESRGLRDWSAAGPAECSAVAQACSDYFDGNPYESWFDPLEAIFEIAGLGTLHDGGACHIDLAPWATEETWSNLGSEEAQKALLKHGEQTLLSLLSSTQFDVLLLNGMSVIKGFECATGVKLSEVDPVAEWDGPGGRSRCWSVPPSLGDVEPRRPATILGWNWHLQNTPRGALIRIADWAARATEQSVA